MICSFIFINCSTNLNLISLLYRAIKRQSSTIFEGINNNLPTSPSGWALAVLGAASVGLQYELHLQKELTSPPLVYCQIGSGSGDDGDRSDKKGGVLNDKMDRIYAKLSRKKSRSSIGQHDRETDEEEGILTRKIKPQMFLGTRGLMSSTAAYALGSNKKDDIQKTRREREVMTMGADGALIVLDWEIPLTSVSQTTIDDDIDIKQPNSITKPIILLLHGMNNDSTFGYIRSMMRTATDRGWIAVCMNFRGQDGDHQIKNNTPRGYNAGFTGDLRGVVQQLEHRLKKKSMSSSSEEDDYVGGPIFILGYSLGKQKLIVHNEAHPLIWALGSDFETKCYECAAYDIVSQFHQQILTSLPTSLLGHVCDHCVELTSVPIRCQRRYQIPRRRIITRDITQMYRRRSCHGKSVTYTLWYNPLPVEYNLGSWCET